MILLIIIVYSDVVSLGDGDCREVKRFQGQELKVANYRDTRWLFGFFEFLYMIDAPSNVRRKNGNKIRKIEQRSYI